MPEKGSSSWFIGVDVGTGSCKSVIVDENGRLISSGLGEYKTNTSHDKWQEQDPQVLLDGLVASARDALQGVDKLPGECGGMSIGGALHSLLVVDRQGRPVTGVMTWADGRASKQAERLRADSGGRELYQKTGCPVHSMYPLYKILWLKEERPHLFAQAARFLSAKEYIYWRLTGEYIVDHCLAAGSGFLNTRTLNWDAGVLEMAGIRAEQLSTPHSPGHIHIGLEPRLARQMGLAAKTPLVLGSADAVNSNIGAGAVSPEMVTCNLGTSGALRFIAQQPVLDPQARCWCYAIDQGHWLVGGAINNGGIALSWLQDLFNSAHTGLPDQVPEISIAELATLAGQVGAGAGGVICLPFFAGERSPHWNLNARAAFLGLGLEHDVRHVARALLEGVAYRLRSVYDALTENASGIQQIRASGGFTRSPLWMQIVADVLNRPLVVPANGETSSLGAAFWAMQSAGLYSQIEETHKLVDVVETFRPEAHNADHYAQIYEIYQGLYTALVPSFEQMVALQE